MWMFVPAEKAVYNDKHESLQMQLWLLVFSKRQMLLPSDQNTSFAHLQHSKASHRFSQSIRLKNKRKNRNASTPKYLGVQMHQ